MHDKHPAWILFLVITSADDMKDGIREAGIQAIYDLLDVTEKRLFAARIEEWENRPEAPVEAR